MSSALKTAVLDGETVIDAASFSYAEFADFLEGFEVPHRLVREDEAGNADLISYRVYGEEKYWWILCVANGIIDPYTEIKVGMEISVPPKSLIDRYNKERVSISKATKVRLN